MAIVTVEIDPKTGEVTIRGEGPATTMLKKRLEGLGKVVERHVGAEHVHTHQDGTTHEHH